jgi:hypothetical protein
MRITLLNKKLYLILLAVFGLSNQFNLSAQVLPAENHELKWHESIEGQAPSFENAQSVNFKGDHFPLFFKRIEITSNHTAIVTNQTYSPVSKNHKNLSEFILEDRFNSIQITQEGNKFFANILINPFRKTQSGSFEKLLSFDILVKAEKTTRSSQQKLKKKSGFTTTSVLSSGTWKKIKVVQEGLHKISSASLAAMGFDLNNTAASKIQLYGHGGGMLPEPNSSERIDDLAQLAIHLVDNNSNDRVDFDDYFLFYSNGPVTWSYDTNRNEYRHQQNIYDNEIFYFITVGTNNGKRLSSKASGSGASYDQTLDYYDQLFYRNSEEENLILSGRNWYGDAFKHENIQTFTHEVSGIRTDIDCRLRSLMVAHSTSATSSSVKANGIQLIGQFYDAVQGGHEYTYLDTPDPKVATFKASGSSIELQYSFNKANFESNAWIDYYELVVPRSLQILDGQTLIYSSQASDANTSRYLLDGSNFILWNVTDLHNAYVQNTHTDGSMKAFVLDDPNASFERFVAHKGEVFLEPSFVGNVLNQNLHSTQGVEYLMVVHPAFKEAATRLAEFHRSHYGYTVALAYTDQIYNEFSSGKQDVTAIRDFVKMVYDRGKNGSFPLKNLLLFGDGSYDYKGYIYPGSNFVPTYQSVNSYIPTLSHCSDDYYTFLDDTEGFWGIRSIKEGLDIGVGRLPSRSLEAANIMVDKIIRYHQPITYGDWRTKITLLGDDEDNNIHFWDSENVAGIIDGSSDLYNVKKIYLDAYEQVSFGSGEKYPDVNTDVDLSFSKGHLIFNYLGHGGESGMAHERVITRPQIRAWDNKNMLPLVITATCELSRFDDPSQDSPGELMLLNDNGGAIALITTTRLVFIGDNSNLNNAVYIENIFKRQGNGQWPTLGEVYKGSKTNSLGTINQRNFILLGDPAMRLAYPALKVETTKITNVATGANVDTLKAFSKIRIEGRVVNQNNQIASDFTGTLQPTIFDKPIIYKTLKNDPGSRVAEFKMQNSILYKGDVTVDTGAFSFEFVVPKDISYQFGTGKISYYAYNQDLDAGGTDLSIVVGGSESNIAGDSTPPEIVLYINDKSFVFGGITDESPTLIAEVFDENGINTVGNGIGRDIRITLDRNTESEEIISANEFYKAKLNSYKEGEIKYPFKDLSPGNHTLTLKLWDVFNNSQEAYTEFLVTDDAGMALDHILNYPNPFTTFTTFHFDHNKAGQNIDVKIKILTSSGRLVKTLTFNNITSGNHFSSIDWDGKDDYGDTIGRGVYVYKVEVKSEDGSKGEEYQKLVILK